MAKILKINNKEKQWYSATNIVTVKTPEGQKDINKVWYNGIADVYNLTFTNEASEEYNIVCTDTHKFRRTDKTWVEAIDMVSGYQFDNSWVFSYMVKLGHKLPTFDIEVPEEHCYVLESGIVTHNSSSILMGNTSPGIEPFRANAYRQDTLSGFHIHKNRWLNKLLESKGLSTSKLDDIWKDIIANDGSVQHLDILSDDEKAVFKTALEIDQRWVVDFAGDRASIIDQGQSVNVFFRPDANIKYLHAVHFAAWKKGVKGLYYLRSDKIRKADKVSQQIERHIIEELDLKAIVDEEECLACQ